MTLFDAVVALVILGLAAVGFLGAFQSTTRAAHHSDEWTQAVAYAEAAMEESKLGGPPPSSGKLDGGYGRRVEMQPWAGAPGVQQVTVTIAMPRGGSFKLQRLVYAP